MEGKNLNVVSQYNNECVEEATKILMRDKRVVDMGRGKFGVHLNQSDDMVHLTLSPRGFKVMYPVEIVLSEKSRFRFEKGTVITAFDLFVMGDHNGNILSAIYDLNNRFLKKKPPYIRVGTKYMKRVSIKDRNGIYRMELKEWNKDTLKDDYGLPFLQLIPKYDGFGIYPDNKHYKETINGLYNNYSKFAHKAMDGDVSEKDIQWSLHLVKHIWGEQWELGLVYLQCLYLYPKQILPILGLVSEERETGKSTFGDWMNIIFGDNVGNITPSNIASNHNTSYASKNIIIIEESIMEKKGDLEKLKAIATQKIITVNPKFISEYQQSFFGKLIMFSNHESKFVRIDKEENRYWVLKVPTLSGKANHGILEDLTKEVPAFLKYLEDLPVPDFSRSRMVFTQDEINTNVLTKTKENSRSGAEKDIDIYLEKEMMEHPEKEYIYFRHEDLYEKYFSRGSSYQVSYIKEVLRDEMKLKMEHRTTEPLINEQYKSGTQRRAYRVPNKYYGIEDEPDTQDEVPF